MAETAAYGALLSHFSALKQGEVDKITAFEVADARQALKLDGAKFISKYPRNANALTVKFNIARAFYDDGEFERSSQLFIAFAMEYPSRRMPRWPASWRWTASGSSTTSRASRTPARKFLGNGRVSSPPSSPTSASTSRRARARRWASWHCRARPRLDGDVVEGLLKVAAENKGATSPRRRSYGAFTAAREKRDYAKEREIGAKLLTDYPRTAYTSDVLTTLGRHSAESGRFAEAAQWYEQLGARMGQDSSAFDGWMAAGRLRLALNDFAGAQKAFQSAANVGAGRRGEALALLAQTIAQGPRSGGRPGHRRPGAEGRTRPIPRPRRWWPRWPPRLLASAPTRWPRRCSRWSTRPPARARIRPRPSGTWGRSSTGTSRPSLRTRSTRRWRRCSSCRASTTSRRRWAARMGGGLAVEAWPVAAVAGRGGGGHPGAGGRLRRRRAAVQGRGRPARCWGNYEGPHHLDIPLTEIIDVALQAKVGALL